MFLMVNRIRRGSIQVPLAPTATLAQKANSSEKLELLRRHSKSGIKLFTRGRGNVYPKRSNTSLYSVWSPQKNAII